MAPTLRNALLAGSLLAGFSALGTTLVTVTLTGTWDRIAANERASMVKSLAALLPPDRYNNDPLLDRLELRAVELGGREPVTVYRARAAGEPVAAFTTLVAPDGYAGPIKLLVGVFHDGKLAGVRVLSHQETPGLGDAIDERRSNWILAFAGKGLGDPPPGDWAVAKDGGSFDQFTGATITPRAVVQAVYNFLEYFNRHRKQFFDSPPSGQVANN